MKYMNFISATNLNKRNAKCTEIYLHISSYLFLQLTSLTHWPHIYIITIKYWMATHTHTQTQRKWVYQTEVFKRKYLYAV